MAYVILIIVFRFGILPRWLAAFYLVGSEEVILLNKFHVQHPSDRGVVANYTRVNLLCVESQ